MSELLKEHLPKLEKQWLSQNNQQVALSTEENAVLNFLSFKIKENNSLNTVQMKYLLQGVIYSFINQSEHPYLTNIDSSTISFFNWINDTYTTLS